MSPEEVNVRILVLEERLSRLAGVLVVLLEAIDAGVAQEAASEIRAALRDDLDEHDPTNDYPGTA